MEELYLEKTEVKFKLYNENNSPEYTAIEYKRGIEVEGEPIPTDDLIYYIGETAVVVGEVQPSTDNERAGIIKWKDNHFNYKQIQFSVSEEKLPKKLLDWLQYVGTQDKDTIRGLKTYIDIKNKKNMETLITTIETTIANNQPIASEDTLGMIKVGNGLAIAADTGVLSVDIDEVSGVKPSWSNITGWPSEDALRAGNDIYYNNIIKTFGDLYNKNQSDLDNFYTKLEDYKSLQSTVKTIQTTVDKIQSQTLQPATKTTLGGVMPDDETIKVDSTGKISSIKVTWRKWTAT